MASNSGVFFSAQVTLQIQASLGYSITFGDFPMDAVRSTTMSTTTTTSLEATNIDGDRSDLTPPTSVTRRLDELSLSGSVTSLPRVAPRPRLDINDILAGLDRVDLSLAECINMAEAALRRPGDSADRFPYGLRNGAATYSDQIRVPAMRPRVVDLTRPHTEWIQSAPISGSDLGYQEASFTLPPNPVRKGSPREISVVSADENSVAGEDEEARRLRLNRNLNREARRNGERFITENETDDQDDDGRAPRGRRRQRNGPAPRNLDEDFVLECDGQNVFATPSANLAAAFEVLETLPDSPELEKARARLKVAAAQVLRMREDHSAHRAQSGMSRQSTPRRKADSEVNQTDLRQRLNSHDVRDNLNNRHRDRDAAERERRRRYDEDHGSPSRSRGGRHHHEHRRHDDRRQDDRRRGNRQDRQRSPSLVIVDNPASDLDGFSAFSNRLRGVAWPHTFKPVGIDKFDGESDPKT